MIVDLPVPDDAFKARRIRELRAMDAREIQRIHPSPELRDQLLGETTNPVDLSDRPHDLLPEISQLAEECLQLIRRRPDRSREAAASWC